MSTWNMHTSILKMETSVDTICAIVALVQTCLWTTHAHVPRATTEIIVSIAAAKPTLVRTVEHVNLIRLTRKVTPAVALTAIVETNVSITVVIPILVGIVDHVNLSQVTREDTRAPVAPTTVGITANCTTTAIPTLVETMDGVQIVRGAHEDIHAIAGMAIMEISASIQMRVYLLLATTGELALEATTVTHATVDLALQEVGVN